MTEAIRHFMVIDDDPISNHISRKLIQLTFPLAHVQAFTRPDIAVAHILENCCCNIEDDQTTVLLLNINMPAMSGWEVLKRMVEVPAIKERFKVFLCSSSDEDNERKNITDSSVVSGFIEKPLFAATLRNLLRV